MNTNIKKLELTIPSTENPFGRLDLEVEIPIFFQEGKQYPTPKEDANVVLSEKSVALLSQLKDSIIEDLYDAK